MDDFTTQKRLFVLLTKMADGFQALEKLNSHSCETCVMGSEKMERGEITAENAFSNVCEYARDLINMIAAAQAITMHMDHIKQMFGQSKSRSVEDYLLKFRGQNNE